MPRIRRYFPVNHDINGDPEVWELTDRFGDRALRVWMEILSITDKSEGVLRGPREQLVDLLRRRCRVSASTCRSILQWSTERSWLVGQPSTSHPPAADQPSAANPSDTLIVRNYAEYHRTRGPNKSLEGTKQALPFLPSFLPSEPSTTSPSGDEAAASPGGRNGFADWPPEWNPLKAKIQTIPFLSRHQHWLMDLDTWKTEDEKFTSVPATLAELVTGAAAFCQREGYRPRSKRGLWRKLHNCMEFEARRLERESQRTKASGAV